MSEKYKKACKYLNYVEHLFVLAPAVTACVSIFCVYFISLCSLLLLVL